MIDEEEEKTRDLEKASFRFDIARDKIQTLKDKINDDQAKITPILKAFVDDSTENLESLN